MYLYSKAYPNFQTLFPFTSNRDYIEPSTDAVYSNGFQHDDTPRHKLHNLYPNLNGQSKTDLKQLTSDILGLPKFR